jgi:hypothetical protein
MLLRLIRSLRGKKVQKSNFWCEFRDSGSKKKTKKDRAIADICLRKQGCGEEKPELTGFFFVYNCRA